MKKIQSSPIYMAAIAVFCTMLWGTAFPAIKIGYIIFQIGENDIPTKLIFAGARFFIAGLIVLVSGMISLKGTEKIKLGKKDLLPVGLLSVFQTFFQYLLLYIGLTHVTGTRSSMLTSVAVFGSVILSAFFWKSDKLTAAKIGGCFVGVAGIILMNFNGASFLGFTLIGDGLVILSNLSGAMGNVISKKISQGRIGTDRNRYT